MAEIVVVPYPCLGIPEDIANNCKAAVSLSCLFHEALYLPFRRSPDYMGSLFLLVFGLLGRGSRSACEPGVSSFIRMQRSAFLFEGFADFIHSRRGGDAEDIVEGGF